MELATLQGRNVQPYMRTAVAPFDLESSESSRILLVIPSGPCLPQPASRPLRFKKYTNILSGPRTRVTFAILSLHLSLLASHKFSPLIFLQESIPPVWLGVCTGV